MGLKQKAAKLSPAAKLQMVMDLMKRKELHECDKCDHIHEVEMGLVDLTKEEFIDILNSKDEE